MSFLRIEKQSLGRAKKAHHFSTKWLAIDALVTTLLTVGVISLTANAQSNATTERLINVGAIELTSAQLNNHMTHDTADGNVYWLGAKSGFLYTVNSAVWGSHWIEYHQTDASAVPNTFAGARVRTFANADFFAAHLEPLQASLLTGVTTPKGRHAAYDPMKLDEVDVHFPGETAVAEVYFSGNRSVQELISAADALVSF